MPEPVEVFGVVHRLDETHVLLRIKDSGVKISFPREVLRAAEPLRYGATVRWQTDGEVQSFSTVTIAPDRAFIQEIEDILCDV
jgi:hypothetical protein